MTQITLIELPIDVIVNILKKLQPSDLFNVLQTCKTLNALVLRENIIWRHVFRNRLILHSNNLRKEKLLWSDLCRVSNNWCNGVFRKKVILQHRINFMPHLKFYNSEALFLSIGSDLWCYGTNKNGFPNCNKVLWKLGVPITRRNDIRTNDISKFVMRNGMLVCGNRDGGVAIYKSMNLRQKPDLICHIEDCHDDGNVEVSAVELIETKNPLLVTGSNDSPNLKLWNLQTEHYEGTKYEAQSIMDIEIDDGSGVRCMDFNKDRDQLAIGLNGNSRPLLLDTNMGKFLMRAETTTDVKQVARDIHWHDKNTVSYVTHSGLLQVVDIRSHEIVYMVKDPFHSTLYCLNTDGRNAIVVGASEYSRCVLFDLRNSSKHVQMYFANQRPSPVYSLDFDASKLTVAVDRGISVLNFNVNHSIPKKDYSDAFHT